MLSINRLSKTFIQGRQEVTVVDNLSLEVKKGEVFGFLGPNGAGKTTTVKMIVGLLFPDTGSITVNNQPAGSITAKQALGFMPENPQFYQYLRAREVLELVGSLFDLTPSETKNRTTKLLKQVGLDVATDRLVGKFSKGMHQRLAFAVALMNKPKLLVLDEPLDGLDPLGRLDFKKLILEQKKAGQTVFFSSHILSDVEELCDRVAIISHGRILKVGSPKELVGRSKQSLEEVFVKTVRDVA